MASLLCRYCTVAHASQTSADDGYRVGSSASLHCRSENSLCVSPGIPFAKHLSAEPRCLRGGSTAAPLEAARQQYVPHGSDEIPASVLEVAGAIMCMHCQHTTSSILIAAVLLFLASQACCDDGVCQTSSLACVCVCFQSAHQNTCLDCCCVIVSSTTGQCR